MSDLAELKKRLKGLEGSRDALEGEIETLNTSIRKTKLEIFVLEKGVTVGDIVLSKGIEYRVTHIDVRYDWLTGNPKKKDGSFGVAERHLYSHWTKP